MNLEKLVRENILKLKPYSSARSKYQSGILLDANENSIGSVLLDYEELQLNRYPDPFQLSIRKSLGNYLSVDIKKIFFGVGSDEIIDLLIRIFCNPGIDNVIIPQPTYGMYEVQSDINNISVRKVLLTNDFQIDTESIFAQIDDSTKMIFLCSPNNPTGNILDREDIVKLAGNFEGIIVIDEAYIDFAADKSSIDIVENFPNLILLRTFSKAWGLAGIRAGYCIANEFIIDILFKVKAPYSINKLTMDAINTAIQKAQVKDDFVNSIIAEREKLVMRLNQFEYVQVFNSDANFILFKCSNADEVFTKLTARNIIIRNRSTQPMLAECLRVSVGTEKENELFIEALEEIL
ncbi:MAG: histidinol-phosphate transaminase [Melioribacteraceae bacterium]|nr:histidinol-phosphate transaminase [Melioribacteraceae bacterium]MCF8354299.1 histidinol-phosphate transaminase [Melioribacteraceae bacterium]MCF8394569.1 histidinol-phosphate transaminase [Melioribacteraceae bacterium]MCF8419762.1 histidinol-phosphate transaminase [Melioribacteraceae bacterium]